MAILDSFAYLRDAIKSCKGSNAVEVIPHPFDPQSTRTERLALIVGYASHGWEHYGQMVVYQRITALFLPPVSEVKSTVEESSIYAQNAPLGRRFERQRLCRIR